MIIQVPTKHSVGKSKDCSSVSCARPRVIFNTNLSLYTTSTPRFVLYYVTVSILLILVISPFNSLTFIFCFVWFCMDIWLLMLFFLGESIQTPLELLIIWMETLLLDWNPLYILFNYELFDSIVTNFKPNQMEKLKIQVF